MKLRRSNRFLSATLAATGFALSLSASFAATATKANTGTDLTGVTAGVWAGGSGTNGSPTSADTATWASTSLGAGLTLDAVGSWGGISATGALSDIDVTGAGTLTLGTTGLALSAVNLSVANPMTLGGAQTWNVAAGKTFTASGIVAKGSNTLTINTGTGTSSLTGGTTGTGTLNVLNGTLAVSGTSSAFGQVNIGNTSSTTITPVLDFSAGSTALGRLNFGGTSARGVMKISGTANITAGGDFVMFGGNGTTNTVGSGVIRQSGGTFTINCGVLMAWAGGAYGAYQISDGILNQGTTGNWEINNQNSTGGLFSQSGGTVNLSNGFRINGNAGSTTIGVVDVSGGTFTHKTAGNFMATTGSGGGVLTVRGAGTIVSEQTTNFYVTNGASGRGFVNVLTGGTLEVNKIQKTTGVATFNADGGTLKAYSTNAGASFFGGLDNAFIYGGGLTLDTAGQNVTIAQALVSPSGYGVGASLGTIAVASGGTGYIAPPVVAFAAPASGVAATGVAEINASGTVTQIRITSPGSGYTSSQPVAVTFNGSDNTSSAASTVAPAFSVTASTLNAAGGLTKIGTGTLTLNTTETYTGATVVSAGTLALGASGALNSASNVSLAAGGTLDVSGLGASATYTLGSGATLLASGTGTTVGTTAAAIKGGATGTVSLGSRPVTLTWGGAASGTDSTHPALTISQGTLSLNSNQFTVLSGTALNAGVYTLATAPAITGTVNPTPLFTGGSGMAGGNVGVVSISGSSVILTVSAASAAINVTGTLSAVTTTYGTASTPASVTVSGSSLTSDITAIAPGGFEISSDGSTYGSGATFTQSGGSAGGTLYVRIRNNSPVSGSFNAQNITLSSPGAGITNVVTAATGNSVSAKALTIPSATGNNKMYDGTTTATVTGNLQSSEAFGAGTSSDGKPYTGDTVTASGPGSFASAAVGNGIAVTVGTPFTLSGASAGNYTVTQPTGLSTTANILNTAVWTQPAGGSWITAGNWQGNIVGSGNGNTADFSTLSLPANATVTLDGARTIGNLVFDDQNTTKHSWSLDPNIPGDLTLAVASGVPNITNNVPVSISTVLAGNQGLVKSGAGTLTLSGTNTLTGGVTISAGTLQLNNNGTHNSNAIQLGVSSGATNPTLALNTSGVTLGALTVPAGVTGATISMPQSSVTVSHSINGATLGSILNVNQSNAGSPNWSQLTWNSKITGGTSPGNDALVFTNTSSMQNYFTTAGTAATHDFSGNVHLKGGVIAVQALANAGANIVVPDASMLWLEAGEWRWNTGSTVETIDGLRGAGLMGNPHNVTLTIAAANGSNEGNRTFTGNLGTMAGVLTKNGSGTQTFSGTAITYTNATTINDGTLELSGTTAFASSAVTVNGGKLLVNNSTGTGTGTTATITVKSGAILAGAGSLGGTATIEGGGFVAPGNGGIGTLTANNAALSGTCQIEVGASTSDLIAVTGTLTTSGTPTIAISTVGTPAAASYTIATYGALVGSQPAVTGVPAGYVVDTATVGQIKLVLNPYAAWAASKGLTAANNGKTQDPDNDQHTNLEEYAFGTDPLTSNSGPITYAGGVVTSTGQPTTSITNNPPNGVDYRAVFGRRKDYVAVGLTYNVQFSTNMTNWVNSGDTPTTVATGTEIDAVSVPYPMFIPTANGQEKPTFFRVGVSQIP